MGLRNLSVWRYFWLKKQGSVHCKYCEKDVSTTAVILKIIFLNHLKCCHHQECIFNCSSAKRKTLMSQTLSLYDKRMNRQWRHKLRYCKRHQARKISCLIKVTDLLRTLWSRTFPSANSFPAVQSVERWLNSCVVLRFCGQVAHLIQIWLSLPFHWDSTAVLVALKRKDWSIPLPCGISRP